MPWKVVWRCVTELFGAQCVTTPGISWMPTLSADNWDLQPLVIVPVGSYVVVHTCKGNYRYIQLDQSFIYWGVQEGIFPPPKAIHESKFFFLLPVCAHHF